MALGGISTYTPAHGKCEFKLEWKATPDLTTLKSKIEVEVFFVSNYSFTYLPAIKGNTLELLENGSVVSSKTFDTSSNYDTITQETSLFKHTFTVEHNDDGTALNWGIRCKLYVDYVEVSGHKNYNTQSSGYYTLQFSSLNISTIQRASTLSVSNGTLGTQQTLFVDRKYTGFSHTISYECGGMDDVICENVKDEAVTWTPPIELASQNTVSTKANVTLTILTIYNGKTLEEKTYAVTYDVPTSVKPNIKLTVTDGEGHFERYGKYIQNVSTFDVVGDITLGEEAKITNLKISANGVEYTESQFTTSTVKKSGRQEIYASVTDERKRTDSESVWVDAYEYMFPIISVLKVKRCDSDGIENTQGEFIQVTFSANITSFDDPITQNSATYALQYKKSTDDEYTTVNFDDITGQFSVSNITYIFPAETGSTYDIIITATDDFTTTSRNTNGSTALVIMHFKASGRGMGIGKISELDDVVDMGFMARFFNGLLLKEVGSGTDYNDLKTPNFYISVSDDIDSYIHCPVECDHYIEVAATADGSMVLQRLTTIETTPRTMIRCYTKDGWGGWV